VPVQSLIRRTPLRTTAATRAARYTLSLHDALPICMRVHLMQKRMTCKEADTLLYYLQRQPGIISAEVYERTGDAVIYYDKTREAREEVTEALKKFRYGDVKVPDSVMENSGRELNARFQEKLLGKIMLRCMGKLLVPFPVRA